QDLFGAADLHELAQIEDPDLITQVADHRQVMGDQQIGQLKSGLQVLEQIQNLSLNGYIQRRDRLVQQQYLRLQCQRPGDGHALALPAAERAGQAFGKFCRQADLFQQLVDPVGVEAVRDHAIQACCRVILNAQRLSDDLPDLHARVQRPVGVLQHRLQQPLPDTAVLTG